MPGRAEHTECRSSPGMTGLRLVPGNLLKDQQTANILLPLTMAILDLDTSIMLQLAKNLYGSIIVVLFCDLHGQKKFHQWMCLERLQ